MTGKTGVAFPFFLMTGLTGLHGHHFRGIARDPFVAIRRILVGLSPHRSMTSSAIGLGHFDMGGMGEKDMIGLPGIDQPWDVFIILFELLGQFDKISLLLGTTLGRFMAFQTFSQAWNPGEAAIGPEIMAVFTFQGDILSMSLVTEMNRLILSGLDKGRESNPPDEQGCQYPDPKK